METKEMNEQLTQVGPGTPMGELLRRYWWPIAGNAELAENPVKAVTILGEHLTLYKDRSGRLGLIGQRCAHRRFDLQFGIPEEEGLRCPYHGWMYDQTGQCIEMPAEPEDSTFKDKVRIPGYPVEELGGLIFAYLGPQPAPLLPRWDLFVMDHVVRQVGYSIIPCNWLQCQENSADTVHTEYLHGHLARYVAERQGREITPTIKSFLRHHLKFTFERYKYGMIKRRLVEGQSEESEEWIHGHPMVFPAMVRLGGAYNQRYELQIRVPMDDTHTYHLAYQCYAPGPQVELPVQDIIPCFEVPLQDEHGNYIFDFVLSQDMVGWWSQGDIVDRSLEKLGQVDKGVILFRRMLKEQMQVVAEGGDPINTFRDSKENEFIWLAEDISDEDRSRMHELAQPFRGSLRTGNAERYSPIIDQLEELFAKAKAAREAQAVPQR